MHGYRIISLQELRGNICNTEWSVFSIWETEPGDELRDYFVCTHVIYPDETQFGEVSKTKLIIERNKRSQVNVQFLGFPIGQTGFYTVKTWVEENQRRIFGPIEFKIELEVVK